MEQDFTGQSEEWLPREHTTQETNAILNFCEDLTVDWGRIDFMEEADGKLIFLEYNANGQWALLDYTQKYGLIEAVIEYLTDSKNAI